MKFFSKKAIKLYLKLGVFFSILFIGYYYFPYRLDFLGHYNKVLAHHCNSIERLDSALKYYKGVELDLVYSEDIDLLDVYHPPSPSTGLSFKNYVDNIKSKEQPLLWLDIKNLDEDNAHLIFKKITSILDDNNFNYSKILIESTSPKSLPIFTEAGFKTSFYLPKRLDLKTPKELEISISKISKVLKDQPDIGISTNFHDYYVLKKYFPNKPKYIWVLVFPINIHLKVTKKILNDPTVKIVLTKYNSL